MLLRYIATIKISAKEKVSGGIPALYVNYLLRLFYLIPILFLWKGLFTTGSVLEMTLSQMMTYTVLSNLLEELLNVKTPMSSWLGGNFFINACKRPTNIMGDFAAQTVGGWLQMLCLFSFPVALICPMFGVSMIPKSFWFFPSLTLCISLGFSIDFLFACFILRLKNAVWLAHSIRMAVSFLFSGAIIPFALLPWGMGDWLRLLPFGSLAGAPLSIFVGLESPIQLILVQMFWNLVLWPVTVYCVNKSRERMVSYGG